MKIKGSSKPCRQVFVIAEGTRDRHVIVHALQRIFGVKSPRNIREVPLHGQGGDARQRVTETLCNELPKLALRPECILVVHMDADSLEPRQARGHIDAVLADLGEPPIASSMKVIAMIPKRCTETWMLVLSGQVGVDEATDKHACKNLINKREREIRIRALEALTSLWQEDGDTDKKFEDLPSLQAFLLDLRAFVERRSSR